MTARLVAVSGPLAGQTVPLGHETLSIGRGAENQVAIDDSCVSRQHCSVKPDGDGFALVDLRSRHGTRVNGQPIESCRLNPGDRIDIGRVRFVFELDGEAAASHGNQPLPPGLRTLDGADLSAVELRPAESPYLQPGRTGADLPDRMARDLGTLLRISQVVASTRDPEALQDRLLQLIAEVIPAERGAILLLPASGASVGAEPAFSSVRTWRRDVTTEDFAFSRTVARRVVAERVALLVSSLLELAQDERISSLAAARVHSVLCVPLVVRDRLLGLIYLDTTATAAPFDQRHLDLAAAIATSAALALDNARRVDHLECENQALRDDASGQSPAVPELIGDAPPLRSLLRLLGRVAPTDSTVLVQGASGTGKELVARALHRQSRRRDRGFVAVNCAAIPEALLESELFGHERGAFTGATARKLGKIELADGGTLFLDEVGELPLVLQSKLLRALQDRAFERVGGNRRVEVDFRLVAATNRDLQEAIRAGRFRPDLYYRLNVVTLTLPPLCERKEDIRALAEHCLRRFAARLDRPVPALSARARSCLLAYDWPGNVRELENALERAVVLAEGSEIQVEDLPESILEATAASGARESPRFHQAVAEAKRAIVSRALDQSGGTITEAARILGLNSNYLHRLMHRLGLKGRGEG